MYNRVAGRKPPRLLMCDVIQLEWKVRNMKDENEFQIVNYFAEIVYRWQCPKCSNHQDCEYKPQKGELLICATCGKQSTCGVEEKNSQGAV